MTPDAASPAPSSTYPVGKLLYKVVGDGRKAVVETWKVTMHRSPSMGHLKGFVVPKAWKNRPKYACLVRIDPPPATYKDEVIASSVLRDRIPLETRIQDTEYGASIPAAARKGLARIKARKTRIEGYLAEAIDEEERKEYVDTLNEFRYVIPAMNRLF